MFSCDYIIELYIYKKYTLKISIALFFLKIIVGGLALPLFGYTAGWLISFILRQEKVDRLAIAIESGIQNTGIAIFILQFALGQPEADLTTVIPVSVAIMTPIPLIGFYFCLRIQNW